MPASLPSLHHTRGGSSLSPLQNRSRHCCSLQRLHLELPPPQVPLAAAAEAVARAAAGEPWAAAPGPAEGAECPPVDGFLLKLLAQVRTS